MRDCLSRSRSRPEVSHDHRWHSLVAFVTAMLAAGLVAAAPLVMAALASGGGEGGLLNLGIEGMMLCGAFFGFYVAYQTGAAFGVSWPGLLPGCHSGCCSPS